MFTFFCVLYYTSMTLVLFGGNITMKCINVYCIRPIIVETRYLKSIICRIILQHLRKVTDLLFI